MIVKFINEFDTISLKEINNVQLLKRFDTKYVLHIDKLISILELMKEGYNVLKIQDIVTQSYKTYYYDDKNQSCYIKHHNGKKNREKIRFRKYLDFDNGFLEVKNKNNKGVTAKKRLETVQEDLFSEKQKKFIKTHSNFSPNNIFLENINTFNRVTFVDKKLSHRLTIDTNFNFFYKNTSTAMSKLVIIEVKESRGDSRALIKKILKDKKVQKNRISKYCISTIMLNKKIKKNNFKRILLKLNKLNILN